MTSPSGSPQRQITTRTLFHQKRGVTSAIRDARDDDMAVASSIPSSASQMRAGLRDPLGVVTKPVARRIAAENSGLRDDLGRRRSAQMKWEATVDGGVPSRGDRGTKRHILPRFCPNKQVGKCTISKNRRCWKRLLEERFAAERQSGERAIHEACGEEPRAVPRLREVTWVVPDERRTNPDSSAPKGKGKNTKAKTNSPNVGSSKGSAAKDRSQPPAKKDGNNNMNICEFHAQGKWKMGEQCAHRHPVPCHNWHNHWSCRTHSKHRYTRGPRSPRRRNTNRSCRFGGKFR